MSPLTVPARPRTLRIRLALAGLGAIAAAGILAMPQAKADTVSDTYAQVWGNLICIRISANPTDAGVTDVAARIISDGLTGDQAGKAMWQAIHDQCPNLMPYAMHWAHSAAPDSSSTPAGVSQVYKA